MKIDNLFRYSIVGIFLLWLILSYPNFYPIPQITSVLVKFFLSIINVNSVLYGQYMIVNFGDFNKIFHLSAECAGIVLFSVFLFGIFLVPKYKLSHQFVSFLFLPLLVFANAFRVFLSVFIARFYSIEFSLFFHDTIGQILMFAFAIFAYIGWLKITDNFPKIERYDNNR